MGHGVPHGEVLVHDKVRAHDMQVLGDDMVQVHGKLELVTGMALAHGMQEPEEHKVLEHKALEHKALEQVDMALVHDTIWEESMELGHRQLLERESKRHRFLLLLHQSE